MFMLGGFMSEGLCPRDLCRVVNVYGLTSGPKVKVVKRSEL